MKLTPVLAAAVLAASAATASAEPLNLTMAGASPGGLWSLLGAGTDAAVKAVDSSSVVTYQTSGGGFANVALVGAGRVDIGLVHDAEMKVALDGEPPFDGPIENLRAIGYMYTWAPEHFFIRKSVAERYGIDSLDDIAAKQAPLDIAVNRAGNIVGDIALAMLEAAGTTEEKLRSWGGSIVRSASGEQAGLIKDGRVDAIGNSLFVLHSSLRDIDESIDAVLLDVPEEVIEKVNERYGTQRYVIPAGTYRNQDRDIATVTLGALIVANESMDEETAYQFTRALIENVDRVKGVHSAMADLTPELMASQKVMPFHPGAERAYREAGLL